MYELHVIMLPHLIHGQCMLEGDKINHTVVENTWISVKISSKLTNMRNNYELKIIVVNKGRIHGELRYF